MAAQRQLEDVELETTSDLEEFCKAWRKRLRVEADVLEMAAAELRGRLAHARGLEKFAAWRSARRVSRRAANAAHLVEAASREIARLWQAYTTEYAEQIQPNKRARAKAGGWDWRK